MAKQRKILPIKLRGRKYNMLPRQARTETVHSLSKRGALHSSIPPAKRGKLTELPAIKIKLQQVFPKHPQLVAVYLYGSLGTKREHRGSDVDLFIIMKDHQNPVKLINSLVSEVKGLGIGRSIDFDVFFESEAKHFLHIGSAQYQYLTVGNVGQLIYGKPVLKRISFSMKQFYLSVAIMSQKIRHEVLNNLGEYTAANFRKSIQFKCGALAFEDPARRKFHPVENLEYVFRKYPTLGRLKNIITSKNSTLEELWRVSETLRTIVERKVKK